MAPIAEPECSKSFLQGSAHSNSEIVNYKWYEMINRCRLEA